MSDNVYWNLQNGAWSVQTGGKVRARWDCVALEGVRLHATEKGVERVKKRGRRTVVAWAVGEAREALAGAQPLEGWVAVSYNPYRAAFFYTTSGDRGREVLGADRAWFQGDKMYLDGVRYGARRV